MPSKSKHGKKHAAAAATAGGERTPPLPPPASADAAPPATFERRQLSDGSANPKYVDLCDEDQPVAGQKFVCVSFISPEKIIKQRESFLFERFVAQWEFSKSMTKFADFLHFVSFKYNLSIEDLTSDLSSFVAEEKQMLTDAQSVTDDYRTFLDQREDELNQQYNKEHAFQTSTRGLKVRGAFNTQEEAELRCRKLREVDPNHDIFVGPVGVWIPFDPDAYKTGRVEFLEEGLNQLHHEKVKNETEAKMAFEARVKETKRKAIEENVRKARESGNKLTQTITPEGDLVGVTQTVNFDDREVADEEATRKYNQELLERTTSKKRV